MYGYVTILVGALFLFLASIALCLLLLGIASIRRGNRFSGAALLFSAAFIAHPYFSATATLFYRNHLCSEEALYRIEIEPKRWILDNPTEAAMIKHEFFWGRRIDANTYEFPINSQFVERRRTTERNISVREVERTIVEKSNGRVVALSRKFESPGGLFEMPLRRPDKCSSQPEFEHTLVEWGNIQYLRRLLNKNSS